MMKGVSLPGLKRIMKKAGAKRISKEALLELKNVVELYAEKLAVDAVMLADHAGRLTVQKSDVKLAERKMP